jgi:hypothetical protein
MRSSAPKLSPPSAPRRRASDLVLPRHPDRRRPLHRPWVVVDVSDQPPPVSAEQPRTLAEKARVIHDFTERQQALIEQLQAELRAAQGALRQAAMNLAVNGGCRSDESWGEAAERIYAELLAAQRTEENDGR